MTDPDRSDAEVTEPNAEGVWLGKYRVHEVLHTEAAAQVRRGFDPDLERWVALERVRVDPVSDDEADVAREGLLRAARALARIAHPGVTSVFDVGVHEGDVVVARELATGTSLHAWRHEAKRSWREVLPVFADAARALHEIHVAGWVHGDLDPERFVIDRDSRVHVGDFTRMRATTLPTATTGPDDSLPAPALDDTDGESRPQPRPVADAGLGRAADQHALCTGLYVALWGQVPAGATVDPPRGDPGDVPARVVRALRRGLDPNPSRRFASMAELARALDDEGRGHALRRAAWAAVIASVISVSLWVATRPGPCAPDEQAWAGVWDDEKRTQVERAFTDSDVPWAEPAWAHAGLQLDRYATQWQAMRQDACEATHVRGEQSSAALDLRMACLDARRRSFAATVEVLAEGTRASIDHTNDLVDRLPALEACADAEVLARGIDAPPPSQQPAVDAVRTDLARAQARGRSGRYLEAKDIARQATRSARALGYEPLLAEALAIEGDALNRAGDPVAARSTLEEAARSAIATRHDDALFDAATSLVWLAGQHERVLPEALRWAEFARATAKRQGGGDVLACAWLENSLAAAYVNAGQFDDALAGYERAATLARGQANGKVLSSTIRANVGQLWKHRGDFARARTEIAAAVGELEPELGRDHPKLASMRGALAMLLDRSGDAEGAATLFRAQIDSMTLAQGEDSSEVARARLNLAVALDHTGRKDESMALTERAVATLERNGDTFDAATGLANLGFDEFAREHWERAEQHFSRALALREKQYPQGHPDLVAPIVGLARVRLEQGRLDEAMPLFIRADELVSATLGPWSIERAAALDGRAKVLAAQGRLAEADTVRIEHVEVTRQAKDTAPDDLPLALAQRAEVLRGLGRYDEALAAADEALGLLPGEGFRRRRAIVEIERAWALRELGRLEEARAAAAAAVTAATEAGPAHARVLATARELLDGLNPPR